MVVVAGSLLSGSSRNVRGWGSAARVGPSGPGQAARFAMPAPFREAFVLAARARALAARAVLVGLLGHTETEDPRHVALRRRSGLHVAVGHHEEVGKGRAKVGPVDVPLVLVPREVDVAALGAEDLHRSRARHVRLPHWQDRHP